MQSLFNILILVTICFSYSCKKQAAQKNYFDIKDSTITNSKKSLQEKLIKNKINAPITIAEIKKIEFLTTTSGIQNAKYSKERCKPDSGYFGNYFLVDRKQGISNPPYFGILTIYTSDKPIEWQFDSKNEKFIRLKLLTRKICIWDSIGVGSTRETILDFTNCYATEIYRNIIKTDFGNYKAEFLIKSDTVESLIVEINCENLEN